ncbi:MAG: ABC transporter ATP-binding protein [Steroidobacteraceae bacterium]
MTDSQGWLAISGLTAGYRQRGVLDALTVPPLPCGQVHAVIGPNAAGKSTLLRALAGLLPASGSVVFGGRELAQLRTAERARIVTYMPQSLPQGLALSVLESVMGAWLATPAADDGGSTQAVERAAATLQRVGIAHLALEPLLRLSGGQRQLVALAQALVREPRLLLLDEPLSALDLQFQLRVMQLLRDLARERGTTALVVLHDLQVAAQWADRILVLDGGRLAACGPPVEAITPELLARVYNVRARVERCSAGRLQVLVDGLLGTH